MRKQEDAEKVSKIRGELLEALGDGSTLMPSTHLEPGDLQGSPCASRTLGTTLACQWSCAQSSPGFWASVVPERKKPGRHKEEDKRLKLASRGLLWGCAGNALRPSPAFNFGRGDAHGRRHWSSSGSAGLEEVSPAHTHRERTS